MANILVLGWYHHRNAGDDRMQVVLTRWLDRHTLAFLPSGRALPTAMLYEWDGVILGGGGLAMGTGALWRRLARQVRRTGVALAVVGVSVEGHKPALRENLRRTIGAASACWLRDAGSADWLGVDQLTDVSVLPDLTFLRPYPIAPVPLQPELVAVNLPHGFGTRPAWREAFGACPAALIPWPLYFEGDGDLAALRSTLPGDSIVPGLPESDEFSMAPLDRAGVVISGRFHGVMFAIQAGRPFLGIALRPKLQRFLIEHGFEDWTIHPDHPERIPERLRELRSSHEQATARVLQVRERLVREVSLGAATIRERFLTACRRAAGSRWRRVRARLARWLA